MAPNIVFAPNIMQNAEREHRTQNTNTAPIRPPYNPFFQVPVPVPVPVLDQASVNTPLVLIQLFCRLEGSPATLGRNPRWINIACSFLSETLYFIERLCFC